MVYYRTIKYLKRQYCYYYNIKQAAITIYSCQGVLKSLQNQVASVYIL